MGTPPPWKLGTRQRGLSHIMSLAAKVAALRSFFGVPDNEPLPLAVEKMNFIMGINGAGPLPKQVDELVRETGVTAAPADAPAAPEAKKHSGCSVEFKKALRPAKFCFLNAAPRL